MARVWDVIIDAGRLGLVGSPEPLIMQQIDAGDAPGFGCRRQAGVRRCGPDSMSGAPPGASSVGWGGPAYRGRDVAKVLGLPVVAALAWQEAEAAVFSRGAAAAPL